MENRQQRDESVPVRSSGTSTAESSHEQPSYNIIDDEDPPTDGKDGPLIGKEDDPLIPSPSAIDRTFHDGKATWEAFLSQASGMPSGLWPAGMLDPYITLIDVPALPQHLPQHLPSGILYGRPRWHVPPDVDAMSNVSGDKLDGDVSLIYGPRVGFLLHGENLICCDVSPNSGSYFLGNSPATTGSLALLTLCWSYILSVRLLEMQGREVEYSKHRLWPQSDKNYANPTIDLEGASPALVRWLCAVLSPDLGWNARDKGPRPAWAASIKMDIRIIIRDPGPATHTLKPPSSSDATELLIELCRMFRLGNNEGSNSGWEPISPYKAAFLAALMLPFYDSMELQPQLPLPHLDRAHGDGTFNTTDGQIIRQYMRDLQYFMTLSITISFPSHLWSIFWQPDIDCNLVSPWLASMLDTLRPSINEKKVETIVKVFFSRRPRVALWWLALFLLGNLSLLDWIQRYAEKLEEKYGFGSQSPPDPVVSAWTGSKQSFLDLERDGTYTDPSELVSRADLLRYRFDMNIQDERGPLLSWRPFGHVQKSQVELELWPQLELGYTRKYHSFTWHMRGKRPVHSYGFRRDTGRHVEKVSDDLERRSSTTKCCSLCKHDIKAAPSEESTLRMMSFLVQDAVGDRNWANAASLSKIGDHRWLRHWEGLCVFDRKIQASPNPSIPRPPTWFLMEWINGKYAYEDGKEN